MPYTPSEIVKARAAQAKAIAKAQAAAQARLNTLSTAKSLSVPLAVAIGARAAQAKASSAAMQAEDDAEGVWHQDIIQRPRSSSNARLNPYLASRDKMHAFYQMTAPVPATVASTFSQTFFIPNNRTFYIANLSVVAFSTGTQNATGSAVGYVSLMDDQTGYVMMDNVPMLSLAQPTLQGQPARPSLRSIWPLPYGIGAGSTFTCQFYTPVGGTVDRINSILIEGWWDFTFA